MNNRRINLYKVIGLCLVAGGAVSLIIAVYSIIISLLEKKHLEEVGAKVTLHFTWHFFVLISIMFVLFIIGSMFLKEKIKVPTSKLIIPPIPSKPNADFFIPHNPPTDNPEIVTPNSDHVMHSPEIVTPSPSKHNSRFHQGGDL